MSEKSKMRRAKREARQEKQAKQVMVWLVGVLGLVALCLLISYILVFTLLESGALMHCFNQGEDRQQHVLHT